MDELEKTDKSGINYVTFFRSYYKEIKECEPEERLQLYDGIMAYMFDDIEPNFTDRGLKLMFKAWRYPLDSSKRKAIASMENGKKGGRPPKQAKEEIDISKLTPSQRDYYLKFGCLPK